MSEAEKFCPGCGEKELRRLDTGEYEEPCTLYIGNGRDFIVKKAEELRLTKEETNAMLKFYGYSERGGK